MKDVLLQLGSVGFLRSIDYIGNPPERQISSEMIISRFKARREVPVEILTAVQNIKDQDMQKRASVHLLRLALYARTIQSGGIMSWFENGKVKDAGSDAKISVSIIKKAAVELNKVANTLSDVQKRVKKLSGPEVEMTKKSQLSLDKASAKADALEKGLEEELHGFLRALDQIYMSSASERK